MAFSLQELPTLVREPALSHIFRKESQMAFQAEEVIDTPTLREMGAEILQGARQGSLFVRQTWARMDKAGKGWTLLAGALFGLGALVGGMMFSASMLSLFLVAGIYVLATRWEPLRWLIVKGGGWVDVVFTILVFLPGGATATSIWFACVAGLYFTLARCIFEPYLETLVAADAEAAAVKKAAKQAEKAEKKGA